MKILVTMHFLHDLIKPLGLTEAALVSRACPTPAQSWIDWQLLLQNIPQIDHRIRSKVRLDVRPGNNYEDICHHALLT